MSRMGTYLHVPGQGLVKVSDDVPRLAPHVWMPKGDLPYYDKSLRMRIESKAHKRQVLAESHLKEGGIIRNPDKRWDGPTRNASKLSWEKKVAHQRRQAQIKATGGTVGLLQRLAT